MLALVYRAVLVVVAVVAVAFWPWKEANQSRFRALQRENTRDYYFTLTTITLGAPNPDVAIGNPLKGLVESPLYTFPPYEADIPLAMEFYYIGLNEVMKGNPKVVGETAAFDWKIMDDALLGSASRKMHAVLRVIIHFPGKPLMLPKYLTDAGIDIRWSREGQSPYYGDAKLLEAIQQFIISYGKRYDGDKRVGFVQAGLLGFWGEWHTYGDDLIPKDVEEKLVGWYAAAFPNTQVQLRYPKKSGYEAGFGLHDDSFAIRTLDGKDNGGQIKSYYLWPRVLSEMKSDFWHRGAMGGETGISIQDEVFEPTYPGGTFEKQSFMTCVQTTHTTYMFHHAAFKVR
jgi:hypothetical protein